MTKEVLVIDDQAGIRMLLSDILENEGYSITTADNGKEALDKLYNHEYDLLIIDYRLPVISGTEILQKLKRDQMEIPVIVISGLADEAGEELAENACVKAVLAKPFDIQQLLETVKKITG